MESQPISQGRQNAIRLMRSRGWAHRRDGKKHIFSRPDTGGLWDMCSITHGNLSLEWAITHCDDPVLAGRIREVRQKWVREAIPGAFSDTPPASEMPTR